jgi:glutathione S-transferase
MEAPMKLYSASLSPNGKRVRICAAELGIALDEVVLDPRTGDARTPQYLALNPMGKWPTLTEGDFALWESAAICWHLAAGRSAQTLLPAEPHSHADLLRWMFFCACHVDPYFTQLVVERFIKPRQGAPSDDAAAASAERWLARFIPVLEGQLQGREYVLGRTFSLADIVLGCTLELSPLLSFDLTPYPNVRRWLARVAERESWRGADRSANV